MQLAYLRRFRSFIPVKLESQLRQAVYTILPVKYHSKYDNVFHCCVWKTASQWLRVVLSDPRIYQYSGLRGTAFTHDHLIRSGQYKAIDFPVGSIITPIYCNYSRFKALQKPMNHRVFFVMRDPRDVLVSAYFSTRYSHRLNNWVAIERQKLEKLSEADGLMYTAERFIRITEILRSWAVAARQDPNVLLIRYEDLTQGNNLNTWARLLAYCDIKMPEKVLSNVLDTYRFENISGGRRQGQEAKTEKYRKGIAGDWKNYFDERLERRFYEVNGDIVGLLGY